MFARVAPFDSKTLEINLIKVLNIPNPFASVITSKLDTTKPVDIENFIEAVGKGVIPTEQFSGISESVGNMYLLHLMEAYRHMMTEDSRVVRKDRVETRIATFLKVRKQSSSLFC